MSETKFFVLDVVKEGNDYGCNAEVGVSSVRLVDEAGSEIDWDQVSWNL